MFWLCAVVILYALRMTYLTGLWKSRAEALRIDYEDAREMCKRTGKAADEALALVTQYEALITEMGGTPPKPKPSLRLLG